MLIFPNEISGIISPVKFVYQLHLGISIWYKRKLSKNGVIVMEQSVVVQAALIIYSIHCLKRKQNFVFFHFSAFRILFFQQQ